MESSLTLFDGNCQKSNFKTLNNWAVLLFSLFTVLPAVANPNPAVDDLSEHKSINDSIAKCKKLEDQDPDTAIALGNELLSKLDAQKDAINYGHVLGCMGWAYVTQNEFAAARTMALDIEQLVIKLDVASVDSIQLARQAGRIFHRMGDRVSASENYNLAMQQAETLNLVAEQIPILINLGVLNSELREHEQAIKNYYHALDLMAETGDFSSHPPVLFNLAVTLSGQKRFTEGLKMFQQVEAMISEQWPPGRISQTYHGLAASYLALDDLSLAREYAEKALKILSDNVQFHANYYNVKSVLANVYIRQGETQLATNFANDAAQFYLDPENRADVLGSTNPMSSLALAFESLGLLDQAIKLHKLANVIEQELQDSFNQEIMAQMQVRLNDIQEREELALIKSQRINDQIKLKEAEYNRKLWMLLSGGGMALLLLFLYWQHVTNRKLTRMSMTDALTQLGNRRAIKAWVATHKIPSAPCFRILWLVDLDNFKAVNDQYDHDVGDFALQKVADALSSLKNKNRIVSRWGGEEFMLITDDVVAEDKVDFSRLLLDTVKQTLIETESKSFSLTASIGISRVVGQSPSAWTKAMYQADKALFSAKSRGQNCVAFATTDNESRKYFHE